MNKDLNFNFCKYQKDVAKNIVPLVKYEEKVEDVDYGKQLLRVIYSIGADGWPVGDLAVYAGKNASPEVQKFILDNLMRDVSSAANPAVVGLSDDQISALTRQAGETCQAYAQRLNDSIDKDKYILNYAKQALSKSRNTKKSETAE